MTDPLTYDVRIWLTESQYAGLLHLAHADDRPLSAYVRRLIQKALDEGLEGREGPHHGRGGSPSGRDGHE